MSVSSPEHLIDVDDTESSETMDIAGFDARAAKRSPFKLDGHLRRRVRGLLIPALFLTAACAIVSGNAWVDLLTIGWRDEESSHVLLVPLVMAWLIWIRRGRLRQCKPDGRWVGTVFVAIGWGMW